LKKKRKLENEPQTNQKKSKLDESLEIYTPFLQPKTQLTNEQIVHAESCQNLNVESFAHGVDRLQQEKFLKMQEEISKKDLELQAVKKELEFLKQKMSTGKFIDAETEMFYNEMTVGMESIMKICTITGKTIQKIQYKEEDTSKIQFPLGKSSFECERKLYFQWTAKSNFSNHLLVLSEIFGFDLINSCVKPPKTGETNLTILPKEKVDDFCNILAERYHSQPADIRSKLGKKCSNLRQEKKEAKVKKEEKEDIHQDESVESMDK
jgi:hypothetical protein